MNQTTLILITIIILPIFAQAQFNKYPIPYRKGDKWGYCDEDKNMIIEPIYDKASLFWHEEVPIKGLTPNTMYISAVEKDGKKGYIDHNGKVLLSPTYPVAYLKSFYEKDKSISTKYVFVQNDEDKVGLISFDGKNRVILPVEYDEIDLSISTLAFAKKGDNYYKIHPLTGEKESISYDIYRDETTYVTWDDGDYAIDGPKKYYKTLSTKEIVTFKEQHQATFDELESQPILQANETSSGYYKISKNGKYGVIRLSQLKRKQLTIYITPKYDEILAIYQNDKNQYSEVDYIVVKKDGKVGIINEFQQTIVPFEYENIFTNQYMRKDYWIVEKNNQTGVISNKNEVIVPMEYDKLKWYNYYTVITKKNDKKGWIDFQDKYTISPKYDAISKVVDFKNDRSNFYELFEVTTNGKKGYINRSGVEYFEDKKEIIGSIQPCQEGKLWGYCDDAGNIIVQPIYDKVKEIKPDARLKELQIAKIYKNNKVGIINQKGEVLLDPLYDDVSVRKFLKTNGEIEYYFTVRDSNDNSGIVSFYERNKIIFPLKYSLQPSWRDTKVRDWIIGYQKDKCYKLHILTGIAEPTTCPEDEPMTDDK